MIGLEGGMVRVLTKAFGDCDILETRTGSPRRSFPTCRGSRARRHRLKCVRPATAQIPPASHHPSDEWQASRGLKHGLHGGLVEQVLRGALGQDVLNKQELRPNVPRARYRGPRNRNQLRTDI